MARQLIKFARGPIVYDSIMMHFIQQKQAALFACSCLFENIMQLNETRNKITSVWVLSRFLHKSKHKNELFQ